VLLVVDQLTKLFFTNQYFEVIPNVLSVYYSENNGAAWSIMSGKVIMLIILSLFFLGILILFSCKFKEKNVFYSICYSFIIGGALGNLIDRIVLSYVRDFVKVDFFNFPIFNLADSFLVLGVLMFCVFIFFIYPKIEAPNNNNEKMDEK
jgi:signal peptidase II